MSRLLALVLSLLLPAAAWGQGVVRSTRGAATSSSAVVTSPSLNAVLYAAFDTPGCYASGSTALAVDGSGTPVAATFSRSATATKFDTDITGRWGTCASNQLRVGGMWTGAMLDAPGTNLFTAPTDSPAATGGWSYIAAGPTAIQNTGGFTYIDGTATVTSFTEAAGVVSGLQQSVSVSTQTYCMSQKFFYGSRQCWGFSLDGSTVHAKFDINNGAVTYCPSYPDCSSSTATVRAGVQALSGNWMHAWACAPLTAGTVTPQMFATAACADNSKAATGGTSVTYFARAQFETKIGNGPAQVTTYTPAGTVRPTEILSFPVQWTGGDYCLGATVEPMNSAWTARTSTDMLSAYSSPETFGSANSMAMQITSQGVGGYVRDNSGIDRSVFLAAASLYPGSQTSNLPHVVKFCVSSTGDLKIGYDGVVSTNPNISGAGTGIISVPPTKVFVGSMSASGLYQQTATAAFSNVVACNVSDPSLCGNWDRRNGWTNAALGDSTTNGFGISGVTVSWPQQAETVSGKKIMNLGRGGRKIADAMGAWSGVKMHRYKYVFVQYGANDSLTVAAPYFEMLRLVYEQIIADGGIPVPMTVWPKNGTGYTEQARKDINTAILRWCQDTGYRCLDVSTMVSDDGTNFSTTKCGGVSCDSGDHLHPSQAALTIVGNAAGALLK